jgi:hypothetical protein
MVSEEIIRSVKDSTVAIGIVNLETKKPHRLCGSGFMVDKIGIIATANHVIEDCKKSQTYAEADGFRTLPAMFRPVNAKEGFHFDVASFENFSHITFPDRDQNFPMSDPDIVFCKVSGPVPNNLSFLKIKKPEKINVFDELIMCGFPSGEDTLDVKGEIFGIRYSPILQRGHVACLLPFDDAELPYGIQTDIIGTGGSSGSPIADPISGEVIGIAQKVIPAGVSCIVTTDSVTDEGKKKILTGQGSSNVGLVYGITNHLLYTITDKAIKNLKGEETGELKVNTTAMGFKNNETF